MNELKFDLTAQGWEPQACLTGLNLIIEACDGIACEICNELRPTGEFLKRPSAIFLDELPNQLSALIFLQKDIPM
jgi:hypothetical protein